MKKILTLFSLILVIVGVQARVVNVDRAALAAGGNVRLAYTASSSGRPAFYVFNRKSGRGFVIVSADDIVGENLVLGYSDNGPFNFDSIPDNFRWLLGEYKGQIESLRASGRSESVKSSPNQPEVIVPPLLGDNKWGQDFPFNMSCPTLNGSYCVTGCVATSMAQIMYYHRWPLIGTGSNEYNWLGNTVSADFGDKPFRWDAMLPYYLSSGLTQDMAEAVSDLMFKCGVSVNMAYGLGESSAYDKDAPVAFKKYFGYTSARSVNRSDYREAEWLSLLKDNLQRKLPMIYSGADDEGGHAFVCDGYNSADYFHFNFGWKGLYDGYFLTSVAGGYVKDQQVVCDIVPGKTPVRADGVFLNRLGNGQAEVTSFGNAGGYISAVTIPESVTVGDETLVITSISSDAFTNSGITSVTIPSGVKRIAPGAFLGCKNLKTIVMKGAVPEVYSGMLFDNDVYSGATLVVPEGSIGLYSSVMPWMCFSHITDGNETMEWTAWIKAGTGKGIFVHGSGSDSFDGTAENMPVSLRIMPNTNNCQFKIDNWMESSTLIINVDLGSGACVVKSQATGKVTTAVNSDLTESVVMVYFSDVPSFSPYYSYYNYPCVFDIETGVFSLNTLFAPQGNSGLLFSLGVYTLALDGYDSSVITPVKAVSQDADASDENLLFNLNGQRVSEPVRGNIYILDGKKILY